jgi:hypothetical protein
MTWHLDLKGEADSIVSNMRTSADSALHGPVGLVSNPLRFLFYATILGAATMLVIQVVNTGLHTAMEED